MSTRSLNKRYNVPVIDEIQTNGAHDFTALTATKAATAMAEDLLQNRNMVRPYLLKIMGTGHAVTLKYMPQLKREKARLEMQDSNGLSMMASAKYKNEQCVKAIRQTAELLGAELVVLQPSTMITALAKKLTGGISASTGYCYKYACIVVQLDRDPNSVFFDH